MPDENKSNWGNAYKSDHLSSEDVHGLVADGRAIVVIDYVKQYTNHEVAGRKLPVCNIAYFTDESIKPFVLNSGNAATVKRFSGAHQYVEDCRNVPIELYVKEGVKLAGSIVEGIRIKPIQPNKPLPILAPDSENWEEVKARVMAKAEEGKAMTYPDITRHYQITEEDWGVLCG